MMDILVCVKQVPDDYAEIRLDPASGKPAVAAVDKVANAFDTYALEMAVRYCEANGGEVTVAAIGPAAADSMMKNLLAVGAKKAYLFSDPVMENGDEAAVAAWLTKVIAKCEAENGKPYGAILCGKESTDEISSQVAARLSELMGVGFVSSVIEIVPQEDKLLAKQETEDGYIQYETSVPAVFSVAKPGYDPRYPSIKSKLAARKAKIPVFSAADAGIEAVEAKAVCVGYQEPPKRSAGVKIQEKEAVDSVSKAMEMLLADKML